MYFIIQQKVSVLVNSVFSIYKVFNVGISVQLLMEINWKQLKAKSVSKQFYICHGALRIIIQVADFKC